MNYPENLDNSQVEVAAREMKKLESLLNQHKDPEQAKNLQRFFKTGKGEYGEGDIFLGIKVPVLRNIAKQGKGLSIENIQTLLDSKIHEKRFMGLLILQDKYNKADDEKSKKQLFDFFLKNYKRINNWDLVDIFAPKIVGHYLLDKADKRKILYELANSSNLWKKRIAILSTLTFIRNNDFKDCLKISKILLNDPHDLIHKAVGWMLREVGKRDQKVEEDFLKKHYQKMPRTMLRYAIEKFERKKRKIYLDGLW